MSVDYASLLSDYDDKGICGLPEVRGNLNKDFKQAHCMTCLDSDYRNLYIIATLLSVIMAYECHYH